MSKAIKWAMVHGDLKATVFDSLDAAAKSAYDADTHGHEYLVGIEHEGVTYNIHWVFQRAANRMRFPNSTPYVVEAYHPSRDQWVEVGEYTSIREAYDVAREISAIIGAERVKVERE